MSGLGPFSYASLNLVGGIVFCGGSIHVVSARGTQSQLAFRHLLDLPKGLVPCSLAIYFPLMTHS